MGSFLTDAYEDTLPINESVYAEVNDNPAVFSIGNIPIKVFVYFAICLSIINIYFTRNVAMHIPSLFCTICIIYLLKLNCLLN